MSKGQKNLGIWFKQNGGSRLVGYTNNDWVGSFENMKSTSGYVFPFGTSVFSWNSKK